MLIYRLDVVRRQRGAVVVRWLGPCHTYVLWPRWVKLERENW